MDRQGKTVLNLETDTCGCCLTFLERHSLRFSKSNWNNKVSCWIWNVLSSLHIDCIPLDKPPGGKTILTLAGGTSSCSLTFLVRHSVLKVWFKINCWLKSKIPPKIIQVNFWTKFHHKYNAPHQSIWTLWFTFPLLVLRHPLDFPSFTAGSSASAVWVPQMCLWIIFGEPLNL